jgi:hypothetical protein
MFAVVVSVVTLGVGATMTLVLALHADEPDISKITAPLFGMVKTITGALIGFIAGRATGLIESGKGPDDKPGPRP